MDGTTGGETLFFVRWTWTWPRAMPLARAREGGCAWSTLATHRCLSLSWVSIMPGRWARHEGLARQCLGRVSVQTPRGSNSSFRLNSMRFRRLPSSQKPCGVPLRCAVRSERTAAGPPWRWPSGTRRAGGTATRLPAPGGPRSGAGSSGPDRSRTRSPLHGQRQREACEDKGRVYPADTYRLDPAGSQKERGCAWKGGRGGGRCARASLLWECFPISARQTREAIGW